MSSTSFFKTTNSLAIICVIVLITLSRISCLHEDQRGKFDWHKTFVGIPKFVYHDDRHNNLIVATETNVVTCIHQTSGSIVWRQLMPPGCHLDRMSIMKSALADQGFLIRTSCNTIEGTNVTQIWNPKNGLLVSDEEYSEVFNDEQAESLVTDQGHIVDKSRQFTLNQDKSLIVSEDGTVALQVGGHYSWTRDESLALISAVEIVQLPVGVRDRFGLKKRIVALTEVGTLFAMDTFTGEIVWKLFDRSLSINKHKSYKSMLYILRQSDDDVDEYKAVAIQSEGFVLIFNPITGQLLEKTKLSNPVKQIVQVEVDNEELGRGVMIVDSHDKVHVYPNNLTDYVKANIDKYYLTVVERSPPTLQGYGFTIIRDDIVPKPIWTFQPGVTEEIVSVKMKRIDEEVHSPARVLGDRGILYKYVNPNIIAIMTQRDSGTECSPDNSINIYLVDGVTGALVHSVHHPKSRIPSNMVISENWLVYSYYHTKNRRTEISSLELFEGTTQSNSSAFSSLSRSAIKPKVIEHKTFIFPSGIEAMVDTVTLRGMTNKHLIVALPNGGLLEMPKLFLDPRRPINMMMEHREEGLIPYMPELPIPSESIINYDQSLMKVRGITTSPAQLESTCLVFAYGLDLFFTRVTPSKTFDILKDDFDHVLIAGVLIFLIVASYVSKLLAQRKALHAAWK